MSNIDVAQLLQSLDDDDDDTPQNPDPVITPATLDGLYVSSQRLDNGDTSVNAGTIYSLTFTFSKAMSSTGVSISSTLGGTISSISTSDEDITFNYLLPVNKFGSTDATTTDTIDITATSSDGAEDDYSATFTVNDLNSSQIEIIMINISLLVSQILMLMEMIIPAVHGYTP